MKLACLGALVLLGVAPAMASADYRYDRGGRYDRGDRYYRGGHDRGSRSSFDLSIGFGSRGHHNHSYTRFGYSSAPRYYGPRYYEAPVYVAPPPVYYAPPPVIYRPAPVYVDPPTYYAPTDGGYYYGGYGRPRAYYYSTGSYYCR